MIHPVKPRGQQDPEGVARWHRFQNIREKMSMLSIRLMGPAARAIFLLSYDEQRPVAARPPAGRADGPSTFEGPFPRDRSSGRGMPAPYIPTGSFSSQVSSGKAASPRGCRWSQPVPWPARPRPGGLGGRRPG